MTRQHRLTAGERLERLLSIIPFVAAGDGVSIDEIASRFDYPREHLLTDLEEVVFLVGLYPFSPDQLIEVMVDDDRVWIRYAEYFEHSLRLSASEALALVTAGQSLLAAPGVDTDGPLARGLHKLAVSLGLGDDTPVEVRLGGADAQVLDVLRGAADTHESVEIVYYAFGRDERTTRVIDPYRLFIEDGQWYVLGHCHQADGERVFRVDRVESAAPTGTTFAPPEYLPPTSTFEPSADDPRITLELTPAVSWVAEHYPVDDIERRDDDSTRVTLAVTAVPWLERLLLRLGSDAAIVATNGDLPPDPAKQAAERILARYGNA